MKNVPATLQHVINYITRGLRKTVTYRDVVIFGETWEENIGQINELSAALKQAGLMISEFGECRVTYLRDQVGCGVVLSRMGRIQQLLISRSLALALS